MLMANKLPAQRSISMNESIFYQTVHKLLLSQLYENLEKTKVFDVTADIVVPAGNHSYPFQVQFRPRLPTSYEGTYGHIRYISTLHIDRSSKKLDPFTETFTVINPLNLDNNSSYRMPLEVRQCTKFNQFCLLFCWKTDDLEIFGKLPVRGYCPGQTMNLKLDVVNKSGQDILHFAVQFVQEVTYTANNGQQKLERIVQSTKLTDGCRADRHNLQSIKVNTLVPSLPPTNFSADVCGSRYMFVIIAYTEICRRNVTFEIPVIIGTYPISNEFYSPSENVTNQTTVLPSAPQIDGYAYGSNISINSSSDLPPYPEADPPTYEEATRSILDVTPQQNFVPKYPTYRRQTSYATEEP
ncbi:arrestin domain-containing protein 1-like isoform X2 [Bradysia coprophila]|uniref:arrestin domain-containing protein 1-like isoform X2 n=1 Tax=Bradysia coprophila TaxID=38358 RepID=UPI00187DC200|nr:arrestin domain-containing protein 1-like isoform X2 [Bradysia coprophila]